MMLPALLRMLNSHSRMRQSGVLLMLSVLARMLASGDALALRTTPLRSSVSDGRATEPRLPRVLKGAQPFARERERLFFDYILDSSPVQAYGVQGPKGSGKQTLLRSYARTYSESVCVIDCSTPSARQPTGLLRALLQQLPLHASAVPEENWSQALEQEFRGEARTALQHRISPALMPAESCSLSELRNAWFQTLVQQVNDICSPDELHTHYWEWFTTLSIVTRAWAAARAAGKLPGLQWPSLVFCNAEVIRTWAEQGQQGPAYALLDFFVTFTQKSQGQNCNIVLTSFDSTFLRWVSACKHAI